MPISYLVHPALRARTLLVLLFVILSGLFAPSSHPVLQHAALVAGFTTPPRAASAIWARQGMVRLNMTHPLLSTYDIRLVDVEAQGEFTCDQVLEPVAVVAPLAPPAPPAVQAKVAGAAVLPETIIPPEPVVPLPERHTIPVCRSEMRMFAALVEHAKLQDRVVAALRESEAGLQGAERTAVDLALQSSYADLRTLAGRRIMIVGDSVDRGDLSYMTALLGENHTTYTHTYNIIQHDRYGDEYSPRSVVIALAPTIEDVRPARQGFARVYSADSPPAQDQIRIDLLFSFGMVEDSMWESKLGRMVIPSELSLRIAQAPGLWGGHADDAYAQQASGGGFGLFPRAQKEAPVNPAAYDLIIINWGLWDLAGHQRRNYMRDGADDFEGLTDEYIEEYRRGFARYVGMLRNMYGDKVPIMLRALHDTRLGSGRWFAPPKPVVAAAVAGAAPAAAPPAPAKPMVPKPAFSPLRTHQLRRIQLQLAQEQGILVNPYALHLEGHYPESYLKDDIHSAPAGTIMYYEMLFRWLAAL